MAKKKIYVLDTNIFLSDFNCIFNFGKNDIVIPIKVLEEIDKHKKRPDTVGANARRSIKTLDEIRLRGNFLNGIRIKTGLGLVKLREAYPDHLPVDFSHNDADNLILSTALSLKKEYSNTRIIVVSKDINMRIRCNALNLETEDYNPEHVKKKTEDIFTGIKKVLVDDYKIDAFYADESIVLEENIFPNEFVILISNENDKKTALAKFVNKYEPLQKIYEWNGNSNKWIINPKNKEQKFALDLLMNPDIKIVSLMGRAGTGKAQPYDSKVLTPTGWVEMGNLQIGDEILTPTGKEVKILNIFEQGEKDIYKVTFTDGSSTQCCKEHLWKTKTSKERDEKKQGKIRNLQEIINTQLYGICNKRNHSISMVKNIEFSKKDLPLEPYLFGILLGDGTFRHQLGISSNDKEIVEKLTLILKKDKMKLSQKNKFDYSIIKEQKEYKNSYKEILKNLKLWNKYSHEKFIPDIYKFSTFEDRLNLLQGLMDSDGTVSKNGKNITFTTTSKQLSLDIQFLIQSLGGTAKTNQRKTKYSYKGIKKEGKTSFRTTVVLDNNIKPFKLTRKLNLIKERIKYHPRRYFDKIELIGKKQARCILIDDPEHLYITDDFIITHNTLISIAAGLEQMSFKENDKKPYRKMIVSRPIQPMGKDIGYLPGSLEEKMKPWIAPIEDNLEFLFSREGKEVLELYYKKGIIEVEALTYIRGRSIQDAFIIIDEAQNLSIHEIKTVLTRVGNNSKIVLTGDIEQIDNISVDALNNGLTYSVEKLKHSNLTGHVTLEKGERSEIATLCAKLL